MNHIRNSHTAWTLLKHLADLDADLVQCSDLDCLRFHIRSKGILGEVVRNSTMKTLVVAGLLSRSRTLIPTYFVSPKGLQQLQREFRRREFGESRIKIGHARKEDGAEFRSMLTGIGPSRA